MKYKMVLLVTMFLFFRNAMAQDNVEINGFVRNYTGVLLNSTSEFSILQNTLNLTFAKQTDKVGFKVNPYLFHYSDSQLELGLREAYLDFYIKDFAFRVGKQQIIWGKAEGVFITDIVSPKDLREFLLPDFEEIRVGVTSVKINYFKGNHSFEAVWTPVFSPTQMPKSDSYWAPEMIFPVTPTWDYSTSTKNLNLENSEAFLRYSFLGSKFDFELVGGHFFYDDPAIHLTKVVDTATMQLSGLVARPDYHRVTMAGGSFSVPIGGLILRGEGAFYDGRFFQINNLVKCDATVEKDYVHYMAGLDYTWKGIKLSTQFIQEYIIDYEDDISNDEFENTMTFLIKKDFFREKLWVELFAYVGLNNEDALIRPRLTYAFSDGFELMTGFNFFTGDAGRFGQYNDNDMVYVKAKYSF